jgi:hypothetical protein
MKARVLFPFILIVSLVLVSSTSGSLARESGLSRVGNPSATAQQARVAELVGQIGGTIPAVALDEDYVYVGAGAGPTTVNLSHPLRLAAVGRTAVLPGVVKGVMMTQSYAYVPTGGWGLHIVEASEPLTMTEHVFLPWVSRNYTPSVTLSGNMFFDINATGEKDLSSVYVGGKELAKIFPDIEGLTPRDIVEKDEPGLSGIEVCAEVDGKDYCTTTDANGDFTLVLPDTTPETVL